MNNKTKILILLTTGFWGGAQKYVCELAEYLSKKDEIEVVVAFGDVKNSGRLVKLLNGLNVRQVNLEYSCRSINNPIRDLMAFRELVNMMKENNFDVVLCNSSKAGVLGRLAGKWVGVKNIYYTAHGWVFNEKINPLMSFVYLTLEKWLSRLTKKIICVSKNDLGLAVQKGFDENKLIYIPNGIDIEKTQKLVQENKELDKLQYWQHSGKRIIGTVANMFPPKNLVLWLQTAKCLSKINPEVRFVIIGDGPQRSKLEQIVDELKLNDIVYLAGNIEYPLPTLNMFDVFLMTSTKEGFPYSLLEAGALKTPIVTTDFAGIGDIFDSPDEVMISSFEANELAGNIQKLLSDVALSARMSQKMYERIEKDYTLDNCLVKTVNTLLDY